MLTISLVTHARRFPPWAEGKDARLFPYRGKVGTAPWQQLLCLGLEELVEAAGSKLHIIKGGTGQPLLLLHDEMGHPGWLRYHAALAQHYTLYIPLHPGCGQSDRLDWMMNIRDLAFWYLDALDELGLSQVSVMGGSLGGWLAAEMAAMCPQQFTRLVLVGAMGIRPPVGEIFDMFLVVSREYLRASFTDLASVAGPAIVRQ